MSNNMFDRWVGRSPIGAAYGELLGPRVTYEARQLVRQYFERQNADASIEGSGQKEFVRLTDVYQNTVVLRRSALRSDAGKLLGHIHYFTDITELARAEAEREQVLQLLSHDMRAPQSSIIALLNQEIDEDAKRRIERNARRTMQLAQDFVDIARMGETGFDGKEVLVVDIVHEAADNFWPLAKERDIEIEISDDSDCAFVLAEPDSLSRAISNILDNAIKFSPDHGKITVRIERNHNPERGISVSFRDQGQGFAPEILPRLFNRFATTKNQKGRTKGIGLGLTYVAAVVKRHSGKIVVSNQIEGGACFIMTLPEALDANIQIE